MKVHIGMGLRGYNQVNNALGKHAKWEGDFSVCININCKPGTDKTELLNGEMELLNKGHLSH